MVSWGGTWVAGRHAVAYAPPLGIAVWRFLIAGLILLALTRLHFGTLPRPTRRQWGLIVAQGFTGIFIYNICFLYGLSHLAAGRAALVVALNPVLTLLASAWLAHEPLTRYKLSGATLAGIGCLIVIGHGNPLALFAGEIGLGEWLILCCALTWTLYTLIGQRLTTRLASLPATTYSSLVGCLMLLLTALIDQPAALNPIYPPSVWLAILFLALLGTTLGFTWFNQAVAELGAARASVFINLVPVAAVLQAAWLLDERLPAAVLGGGGLVILGVMLTQRSQQRSCFSVVK